MKKIRLFGMRRLLTLRSFVWGKLPSRYHRLDAMRHPRPSRGSRLRWRRRYSG